MAIADTAESAVADDGYREATLLLKEVLVLTCSREFEFGAKHEATEARDSCRNAVATSALAR